jgi:hypothetical protein
VLALGSVFGVPQPTNVTNATGAIRARCCAQDVAAD